MVKATCSVPGCGRVERLRRGMCYAHYWEEHLREREPCSHEGCQEPASRRRLCGRHYKQWQALNNPPCSIEGCPNRTISRGWCRAHYGLWRKYGDPLTMAPRQRCAWPKGCDREVVISRTRSGLCAYHCNRRWKKSNPKLVNASNRRYAKRNPGKVAIWEKKWRAANPGKAAEYAAARQARLRGQFVERVYRSVVFKRDKGICGLCGKKVDPDNWHLDHIMPISQGGEHSYANVQVSHPFCNVSKGAKIIDFQLRLA